MMIDVERVFKKKTTLGQTALPVYFLSPCIELEISKEKVPR